MSRTRFRVNPHSIVAWISVWPVWLGVHTARFLKCVWSFSNIMYEGIYHFRFFKGFLPKNLLGSFLSIVSHFFRQIRLRVKISVNEQRRISYHLKNFISLLQSARWKEQTLILEIPPYLFLILYDSK